MKVLILWCSVIFTVFLVTVAQASDFEQVDRQEAVRSQDLFEQAKQQLEALPDAAPYLERKVLTEQYLLAAVYMVYRAKISANSTWGGDVETTNDLTQLVALGYLTTWPTNPLKGDAPMAVHTAGGAFTPGDLVMLTAPPSHYTSLKAGPTAVSFMLFIYGMEKAHGQLGRHVLNDKNKEWGCIPPGALYGWDQWVESDAQTEEREAYIEQWKKDHPEEAAKIKAAQKAAKEKRGE